jgi:hypothetical protein
LDTKERLKVQVQETEGRTRELDRLHQQKCQKISDMEESHWIIQRKLEARVGDLEMQLKDKEARHKAELFAKQQVIQQLRYCMEDEFQIERRKLINVTNAKDELEKSKEELHRLIECRTKEHGKSLRDIHHITLS